MARRPNPAAARRRVACTRSATEVSKVSLRAGRSAASSAVLQDPKWPATQELLGQRGCSPIHLRCAGPARSGLSPHQSTRRGALPVSPTHSRSARRIDARSHLRGTPGWRTGT